MISHFLKDRRSPLEEASEFAVMALFGPVSYNEVLKKQENS
jgi:hypothetical protein